MARSTPGIKTKEYLRILRRRGCVEIRSRGGHTIFEAPNGSRFPVPSHPKGMPTFAVIKCATEALDCTIEELLYG